MYEVFEKLLKEKGMRVSDFCKATGISAGTMSDWKSGRFLTELDALVMPVEAPESPVLGFDAVDGINLYKQLGDEEKRLFWRRIIREITFNQNKEMKVYFL